MRPHEVSRGSGRKIWWKCQLGPDHEWRATANNRISGGTGCPFCAGRLPSVTNSLARLRPDLAKQWHRTKNQGLTPDRVVAGTGRRVWWKCPVAPDHEWQVSPHARSRAEGACPFCVGLRVSKTNSLASREPRIAREWHPFKNGKLTPADVVSGSARTVWWRCRRQAEHQWRASIANRVVRGSGCPFCAGRKASPEHCLESSYPAIAREWHPSLNAGLTPRSVTPHARREVWWRCSAGHEWRCPIIQRTRRGSHCSLCARPASVAARGRTSHGGGHLRWEHRRIEQLLLLLADDPAVDDALLQCVLRDVTAHLAAEEDLVYPALEHGRAPLHQQREIDWRVRILASKISGAPRAARAAYLHNLSATFREHARRVENDVLPALDSALGSAELEAPERLARTKATPRP
jgi:hypothetical protein